jgi:hypothetical protein
LISADLADDWILGMADPIARMPPAGHPDQTVENPDCAEILARILSWTAGSH